MTVQCSAKNKLKKLEQILKKKAAKIWGGARANSGRKTKPKGELLSFTKRLTEKEIRFIDYARAHNINYDDLMQG